MISKLDVLSLLSELKDRGEDVTTYEQEVIKNVSVPLSVIKFLNEKRSFEVSKFFEKLRYSYNHKKSNLYLNIVKEISDVEDVLTTLASYNLQVLIYAKKVEDKEMFYRNTRVEEVTRVLNNYYKTFDLEECITVLSLLKADIKLFESVKE